MVNRRNRTRSSGRSLISDSWVQRLATSDQRMVPPAPHNRSIVEIVNTDDTNNYSLRFIVFLPVSIVKRMSVGFVPFANRYSSGAGRPQIPNPGTGNRRTPSPSFLIRKSPSPLHYSPAALPGTGGVRRLPIPSCAPPHFVRWAASSRIPSDASRIPAPDLPFASRQSLFANYNNETGVTPINFP